MRTRKIINIVAISAFSILLLCSCTSQNSKKVSDNISTTEEITEELTTEEITTEEPTTEYVRLSEQCDATLCEEEEGDYYQLVANEEEDYQGVKIKVGVIKNNEWILKPTSKMPLVDEDKTLYGSDISGLDDAPDSIYYIGSGCFLYRARTKDFHSTYEEIIYNVNNQKYYEQKDREDNEIIVALPRPLNYTTSEDLEGAPEYNLKDIIVAIENYESNTVVTVLNLATMKTKEININIPDEIDNQQLIVHPLSNGIFAIAGKYDGCTFYNEKGKELFTVSYEEIPYEYLYEPIAFKNSKCSIIVENNKGTVYTIVVDKKGKIVKQVELE